MKLFEWQKRPNPYKDEQLTRFNAYLNEVWENRRRFLERDEALLSSKHQRFFNFTFDGNIVARNYVGVVQFEGQRIEVIPKIFRGQTAELRSNWKYNLLFWLSYCRKIRFPFSLSALSALPFDDFLELLIYLFAHYTEEVIGRQPYQQYETVTEEMSYLRGRLAFDPYLRNNLTTGKWQHFTCQHQPLLFDNRLNRLIKYVARRLLQVSKHTHSREKLGSILFMLDEVADVSCTSDDCDQVKLNNLYQDHQHVLELCRMFLSHQMIDTSSAEKDNFCFLIPMEYVFEDFIFGFLQTHFGQYRFRPQSKTYLAKNEEQPVFEIRNDIYVERHLVIDTKYKIRADDQSNQQGISQNDVYQMLAYSLRRECRSALLLYPYYPSANNAPVSFNITSEKLKETVRISAASVNIIIQNQADAVEIIATQLEQALNLERH